jgi:glutaconate CoA-transferase subunit A
MNKTMELDGVVARLRSGMTIGIGGWGPRRKPMAIIRAILKSDLTDLTVVSYGGPEVGMLCAAGKVRRLVYGFVSLDFIPIEPFFRRARERGLVEAKELDEGLLLLGLQAAAHRLPFLPTRVGLGTDVLAFNPEFRTVASPYADGEILLAMPAIRLDAALLHASRADRLGNTQSDGPDPYFDALFARAADACYVSAEAVCERMDLAHPDTARTNLFERTLVTGVIHAPLGAHPTAMHDDYGWDAEHLRQYAAAAGEDDGWRRYAEAWLTGSEADYLARAGGAAHVRDLPLPVF